MKNRFLDEAKEKSSGLWDSAELQNIDPEKRIQMFCSPAELLPDLLKEAELFKVPKLNLLPRIVKAPLVEEQFSHITDSSEEGSKEG